MAYSGVLDLQELINIYDKLIELRGRASCADVAEELTKRGYESPTTGEPFTRQAVWYRLNQSERGRELLNQTRYRMGKDPGREQAA